MGCGHKKCEICHTPFLPLYPRGVDFGVEAEEEGGEAEVYLFLWIITCSVRTGRVPIFIAVAIPLVLLALHFGLLFCKMKEGERIILV